MPRHRVKQILSQFLPKKDQPTRETSESQIKKEKPHLKSRFEAWKSLWQAERNVKLFKAAQDIHIVERAQSNFRKLITTIKLTKAEKQWVMELMESNSFHGIHLTNEIASIQQEGRMLSVAERRRRKTQQERVKDHTGTFEGNQDNLFFTPGFGDDLDSAAFVRKASHKIRIDFGTLRQSNPHLVRQIWSSDHFYAYTNEHEETVELFYGTKRKIQHVRKSEANKDKISEYRLTTYTYPDGRQHVERTEIGDLIFLGRHIELAMCLLAVKEIRLLGQKAHSQIMQEKTLKAKQQLVNTLLHAGIFEMHKPVEMPIDQPGIEVTQNTIYSATASKDATSLLTYDTFILAFQGRTKEVLELCSNFSSNHDSHENLFLFLCNSAILGGQVETVRALLDTPQSITLMTPRRLLPHSDYWSPFSPLSCCPQVMVMSLLEPAVLQPHFKGIPLVRAPEKAKDIATVLYERGVIRKNVHIRYPVLLSSTECSEALKLGFSVKTVQQFLSYFTKKGYFDLDVVEFVNKHSQSVSPEAIKEGLEFLVSLGMDFNQTRFDADKSESHPLICHCILKYPTIAKFFIPFVNLETTIGQISFTLDDKQHSLYMGYTALLLACELEQIDNARLLLEGGANPAYQTQSGESIFSIARRRNNDQLKALCTPYEHIEKEMTTPLNVNTSPTDGVKFKFFDQTIVYQLKDKHGKPIFIFIERRPEPFTDPVKTLQTEIDDIREWWFRFGNVRHLNAIGSHDIAAEVLPYSYRVDDEEYHSDFFMFDINQTLFPEEIAKAKHGAMVLFYQNESFSLFIEEESGGNKASFDFLIKIFEYRISEESQWHAITTLAYQRQIQTKRAIIAAVLTGNINAFRRLVGENPALLEERFNVISADRASWNSVHILQMTIQERQFEMAEWLLQQRLPRYVLHSILNKKCANIIFQHDQNRFLELYMVKEDSSEKPFPFDISDFNLLAAMEAQALNCSIYLLQRSTEETRKQVRDNSSFASLSTAMFDKASKKAATLFLAAKERHGEASKQFTNTIEFMRFLDPNKTKMWLEEQETFHVSSKSPTRYTPLRDGTSINHATLKSASRNSSSLAPAHPAPRSKAYSKPKSAL